MAIDIRPLGKLFGAEIKGVDLSQALDSGTRAEILQAWSRHLVLLFRGQSLKPEHLLSFARGLGELDLAPPFDVENTALDGFPEIAVVSNIVEKGKPAGGLGAGELTWHSDMVYRPNPPVACALFAVEVPPDAGNTHFLSVAAARAQLPSDIERDIAGKKLLHDRRYTSAGTLRRKDEAEKPPIAHPIVIDDPVSGKPVLLLGRRPNSRVVDETPEASQKILDAVWTHTENPKFTIQHSWKPGDVILWNNIAVMHKRDAFDNTLRRRLFRAQISKLHPQVAQIAQGRTAEATA
jgi:taurine dioxygenase